MTVYCGVDFHGLRCKDYFRAWKYVGCLSLSSDAEQRSDEGRLTLCITSR